MTWMILLTMSGRLTLLFAESGPPLFPAAASRLFFVARHANARQRQRDRVSLALEISRKTQSLTLVPSLLFLLRSLPGSHPTLRVSLSPERSRAFHRRPQRASDTSSSPAAPLFRNPQRTMPRQRPLQDLSGTSPPAGEVLLVAVPALLVGMGLLVAVPALLAVVVGQTQAVLLVATGLLMVVPGEEPPVDHPDQTRP